METRVLPGFALNDQLPVVISHNAVADGKPESRSGFLALGGEKGIEDSVADFRGNPRARIFHRCSDVSRSFPVNLKLLSSPSIVLVHIISPNGSYLLCSNISPSIIPQALILSLEILYHKRINLSNQKTQ